MRNTLIALALVAAGAGTARADNWTGTGELGLALARGNSDSDTVNARVSLKRESDPWLYEASLGALRAKGEVDRTLPDGSVVRDKVTNANRYDVGGKLGYKLSERAYVFGTARYDDDDFAPYQWQSVLSAGFGYHLIKSEATQLSAEVGPGFRRYQPASLVVVNPDPPPAQVSVDPDAQSDAVARGALTLKHKLTANTELANALLVESGGGRTFVQNDLGVTVKMSEKLALKTGLQLRYNSNTTPGVDSTDKLFTTNIVVGF